MSDDAEASHISSPQEVASQDAPPPSQSAPTSSSSIDSSAILPSRLLPVPHADSAAQRHAFWETQPVGQFADALLRPDLPEGPIEAPRPPSSERQDPYPLPSAFEWATCDLDDDATVTEVYTLLTNNYVEDDDNMFRFDYSPAFLRWALQPPGHVRAWIIGVRAKSSRRLVAFISGVPATLRVRSTQLKLAEINFLCVHKKLRSKRLAPVMIKEVTRRVHLEDSWNAVYTAGVVLPTPASTAQYWHRSLNPKKLIDVGFSRLAPRMTLSRTLKLYKLPDVPATSGLRPMRRDDVPAVTTLLRTYLGQFEVAPELSEEEVAHLLVQPMEEGVVYAFVATAEGRGGSRNDDEDKVTDLISFYALPSTIIGNVNYSKLRAAYSFYNVSTVTPLPQLMNDALILAKQHDFDVFNALDIMHNATFLKDLKFGPGDGFLHYYLYNYRLKGPLQPSQLGLVLL